MQTIFHFLRVRNAVTVHYVNKEDKEIVYEGKVCAIDERNSRLKVAYRPDSKILRHDDVNTFGMKDGLVTDSNKKLFISVPLAVSTEVTMHTLYVGGKDTNVTEGIVTSVDSKWFSVAFVVERNIPVTRYFSRFTFRERGELQTKRLVIPNHMEQ